MLPVLAVTIVMAEPASPTAPGKAPERTLKVSQPTRGLALQLSALPPLISFMLIACTAELPCSTPKPIERGPVVSHSPVEVVLGVPQPTGAQTALGPSRNSVAAKRSVRRSMSETHFQHQLHASGKLIQRRSAYRQRPKAEPPKLCQAKVWTLQEGDRRPTPRS